MSSARWSAAETKFAGPFSETCRFATSPKSRFRLRPALRAAAIITLSRADWAGTSDSRRVVMAPMRDVEGRFGPLIAVKAREINLRYERGAACANHSRAAF